ncbi:hypothetical protein Tco_1430782 [Tanacetum coccineum]
MSDMLWLYSRGSMDVSLWYGYTLVGSLDESIFRLLVGSPGASTGLHNLLYWIYRSFSSPDFQTPPRYSPGSSPGVVCHLECNSYALNVGMLDEMLDVKGNTFVYLLNTLALVHSIMKNSRREMFKLKKELVAKERDLALHLVRFTDVVEDHSGILKRPTVTREIPILTRGGLFLLPGLKIQDGWSEFSCNDVGFDCMLHNSATAVSKEEKKLKKFWEEDRQVKCEYMSFRSKAGVLRIYYILLRDAIDVTMELRYVSPLPDLEGFKVRRHVFAYYDGVLNEVDDTKKMCYKAIVF